MNIEPQASRPDPGQRGPRRKILLGRVDRGQRHIDPRSRPTAEDDASRSRLSVALTILAVLAFSPVAQAQAAPVFTLDLHHNPTHFIPGGTSVPLDTSTLTEGSAPATNEVQQITVGLATSGNFKLSFNGNTTPNLPFNATTSQIESALRALPSIGASNVNVSGSNSGVQLLATVTFTGAKAATNVPQITASQGSPRLAIEPEYWVGLTNVGPDASAGPITVSIDLPPGMSRQLVSVGEGSTAWGLIDNPAHWSCPGAVGDSTITCTGSGSIGRHDMDTALKVAVKVSSSLGVGDVETTTATVSGGGAQDAPPAAGCPAGVAACTSEPTLIEVDPAGFGIVAESFQPGFFAADGVTPELQAGAHPDLLTVPFDFNSVDAPNTNVGGGSQGGRDHKAQAGSVRDLDVDLPPGFLGDPTAIGDCPQGLLVTRDCPASSQVGRFDTMLGTPWSKHEPVYNLAHPKGAVSDLAFVVQGNPVHIRATLDPANHYAITTHVPDINETFPVMHQRLTLWGVPADPSHDSERCKPQPLQSIATQNECPANHARKPFLTVPFQCNVDHPWRLHGLDSWQDTGVFGPDITYSPPDQLTGCDATQAEFHPSVSVVPTNTRADSPTGFDISANVPFNDDPDGLATPPVKRLEVTLPEGMAINPDFADGLRGCTETEIGITHAGVPDDSPVTCPDASRIGAVELSTPLLPDPASFPADCPGTEPLQGSIYLARQSENPVNSLFAIYTVIHDCEHRGVLIKLPGAMSLDPVTGQITTTFDQLPQFPFDHLSVKFRGGDRAPLVNPPTCGTKTISGSLNTWTKPGDDVPVSSSYEITNGADGGPCFADLISRPFAPVLEAGTRESTAATFSPFVLKLSRSDGEQEPIRLTADLPPGLTGKLAGISQCPDQVINSISAEPATGNPELANPSCPLNSRVGHVNAGSGAGSQPFYVGGSVYLAGPYDPDGAGPEPEAPLSLAIVTPVVTGGFDLGNVVLRSALYVDPRTAQIHVDSGPIPTIVHGVPIHLRDIRVVMDRPDFTINATNCQAMAVHTTSVGSSGAVSEAQARYQASDCKSLNFSPDLSFTASGGKKATKRNQHPGLDAELSYPPGYLEGGARQANIASVEVTLPKQMLLDQSSPAFQTICTRPQYAANQCPASTQVGIATATSPLLDEPLSGPVYLKSSDNQLPDLAADLNGIIDVDVFGRIDQDHGRIRNTFDVVPDAPVSHFSLQIEGGPDGVLVNANAGKGLCESKKRRQIDVIMNAQNGARQTTHPMLQAKCPKKGHRGHGHGH